MARCGSCRKLGRNKRTCQKSAEIGESSANSRTSEMEVIAEASPKTGHVMEPHVTSIQERNVERAPWNFNVNTAELHNTYIGPMKLAKTLPVRKSGYKTTVGGVVVKSTPFSRKNGANVITSSQLKEALAVAKAKIGEGINKNLTMEKEK